ncbi:hypothetical protein [Paucibacter sp. Y2R2-4]|uniref:hypothetical protein n=1 Tax=Paucibacter sp. Y2R2-4 TaxID=2893553 RepID=UPI0021E3781E|nr:hypothetical protein [Paucibacter sp. Y2R2-4]MCV2349303.1 hypothetical protein [Paucibacter sp. Y2R2-4]
MDRVTFRCLVCRHDWAAQPDLVEPDPDPAAAHHPFRYYGNCPACDEEHQPQAPWERALLKAHQMSTGPKTPAGQANSAANLEGHPTPEEALRTRFNAMKHGLNARVAHYFPAKPDGYAFCSGCEVNRYWCGEQPACVKQTELFMLHSAAFEQKNPKALAKIHGDLHAALVASLQMCLQAVLGDGVVLKVPKVHVDKEGNCVTLTYVDEHGQLRNVMEYSANPAFKPIADLVSRLGLSLSDLGMTIKAQEDEEAQLRGRLGADAKPVEMLQDFSNRMAAALERMPALVEASRKAAAQDPVLLEHEAQTGRSSAK